jgi:hypothetical protein
MSLTKLSLAGIIKIFPPRESLVSYISDGDGKSVTFFYSVYTTKEIIKTTQ